MLKFKRESKIYALNRIALLAIFRMLRSSMPEKTLENTILVSQTPSSKLNTKIIIIFLFILLLTLFLFTLYLFETNRRVAKEDEILKKIDVGVVSSRVIDPATGSLGSKTRKIILAMATGKVFEKDMLDAETGVKIGKLSAARFKLKDASGNPLEMDLIVQIIPQGGKSMYWTTTSVTL